MPLDPNFPPVDSRPREEMRDWYGYLADDTVEHIAQRIKNLLTGRRYTWVDYNRALTSSFPNVRTGQRLTPQDHVSKTTPTFHHIGDKSSWSSPWTTCGISVSDSYGSWGLHSFHTTEDDARADAQDPERMHRTTFVSIVGGRTDDPRDRGQHDRIEIAFYNTYTPRERIMWVIAVEPPDRELLKERDELLAAIREVEASWESGDLAGAVNRATGLLPDEESDNA